MLDLRNWENELFIYSQEEDSGWSCSVGGWVFKNLFFDL